MVTNYIKKIKIAYLYDLMDAHARIAYTIVR